MTKSLEIFSSFSYREETREAKRKQTNKQKLTQDHKKQQHNTQNS